MPKKLLKLVLTLLAMILSPLILAAIAIAAFIVVQLLNGESFSAALQALTIVFKDLQPFLPYITGIPAVMILVTVLLPNRSKIQRWFQK